MNIKHDYTENNPHVNLQQFIRGGSLFQKIVPRCFLDDFGPIKKPVFFEISHVYNPYIPQIVGFKGGQEFSGPMIFLI
jgi:hypothetical protein